MGWNDVSRLVNILFFRILYKGIKYNMKLSAIIFLIIVIASSAFSQEAAKSEAPPEYLLKFKPPNGIRHVYKYHDSTSVTRYLSDSSVKKYTREITFYFNFKMPESPKEGFMEFDVSIDSMHYKFTEGEAVFEFDSQADNPGSMSFEDLISYMVPLGKEYNMTYSPYGEVAKIEGEKIDNLLDLINQQKGAKMDPLRAFVWTDGVSKERLQFITDVKKVNFPLEPVQKDSLWTSPFNIQFENMNFYDTLTSKISKISNGYISIECKSGNLRAIPKAGKFYGIKTQLVEIKECKGTGNYNIIMHPKGFISESEAIFTLTIGANVKKDYFREKIDSRIKWELLKQFQY
jgi:hypothetical protein